MRGKSVSPHCYVPLPLFLGVGRKKGGRNSGAVQNKYMWFLLCPRMVYRIGSL